MQDLEDFSISTTLYPLPPTVFKSDCFFSQLLPVSEEERITRELDVGSSIDKLKHLATDLNRKVFTKRTLLNGELKIKNVAISFNMYATLHSSTVGAAVQLDAKTNDTLRCETKFICLETGSLLEDFQMKTYYEYAGEKVYISKSDVQELKKIQSPGLELMGFKPMANLTVYHNVKNPGFIYPNENEIKNSTIAFKALLEEMKRQNVFGVARLLFRAAGLVRFVALVPQVEEWNATKTFLLKNPGFNMIPLPYADEIRNVKVPAVSEVSADLVKHAKNISDILLFEGDYAPQDMSNPALQKFYRALEATALNLDFDNDAVNEEVDKVKMNIDLEDVINFSSLVFLFQFQSYFDDFTNTLNEVAPPAVAPVKKARAPAGSKAVAAPKKRKAADESDDEVDEPKPKKAAAPRKKKADSDDDDVQVKDEGKDIESFKKLWEQNKLGTQTVPILKDMLKACGLPVSGTKAALIEKLSAHFSSMQWK